MIYLMISYFGYCLYSLFLRLLWFLRIFEKAFPCSRVEHNECNEILFLKCRALPREGHLSSLRFSSRETKQMWKVQSLSHSCTNSGTDPGGFWLAQSPVAVCFVFLLNVKRIYPSLVI